MLASAGVAFEVVRPDVDERGIETSMAGAPPEEIAQALAAAKAVAVSQGRSEQIVLGSDSLVVVEGQRFDKPGSRAQAGEHLRAFSGRIMELNSAATLARDGRIVWVDHAIARLSVRPLSDAFIEAYLDTEWPAIGQCAGAFRIEGPGVQLFERIVGDHFTILGMPLLPVLAALREQGELPG